MTSRWRSTRVTLLIVCLVSTSMMPVLAHAAVGRTAANATVGTQGDAQLSIPIEVPAGTGRLAPSLSISYSSKRGDGLLGVGFGITGLSSITRCNGTIVQDGVASAVSVYGVDRMCIGGNRLRLVSGTDGAIGATYQLEREVFTRFTIIDADASGPLWIEARTRQGEIIDYGREASSRVNAYIFGTPFSVRAWAISRISDRSGNYVAFSYEQDTDGGHRPLSIDWTQNDAQGLSARYRVAFVYETATRPDPLRYFQWGTAGDYGIEGRAFEFKRLDRIDVMALPSQILKRYELSYDAGGGAGGASRLSSVQECGLGGTDCFPATNFSWINGTVSWLAESSSGQAIATSNNAFPMDINGDGRDDLVWSSSATSGAGTWQYRLANASGGYDAAVNTGVSNANYSRAFPIEWDGDGRWDLLIPLSGTTWWVLRANGAGFDAPLNTGAPNTGWNGAAWTADVDGDGRDDLIRADVALSRLYTRLRTGTGFAATETMFQIPFGYGITTPSGGTPFGFVRDKFKSSARRVDFDGDGRDDITLLLSITSCTKSLGILYGESGTFALDAENNVLTVNSQCNTNAFTAPRLYGDFNGDGLTDIGYFFANGPSASTLNFRVAASRGRGMVDLDGFVVTPYASASIVAADWDADGLDDVVLRHTATSQWWLARSTGDGLATEVSTGVATSASAHASVTDVNGDALDDIANVNAGTWRTSLHAGVYPDLLDTATDANGVVSDFDYAPLTDSTVYTRGSAAVYPERDVQDSTYVARRLSISDGTVALGTRQFSYTYQSARRHLQGRGWLGFGRRDMTDSGGGFNRRTEEQFFQSFPYTGIRSSVVERQSSGTKIREVIRAMQSLSYGTGFLSRLHPYIVSEEERFHEVGGTAVNGVHFRTINYAVAAIDAYGTVTDATTTATEVATGLSTGASRTSRVLHSAVLNDASAWCIGRPTSTQIINSHTLFGGSGVTRTVSNAWNAARCRVSQSIEEPGSAQWQVTRTFGYDDDAGNAQPDFGNKTSETVTGVGMTPRTTEWDWGTSGQLPELVRNPAGETIDPTYDYARALRVSELDGNGLASSWQYDSFGRITRHTHTDGTATSWTYNSCVSLGCVGGNNRMIVVASELNNASAVVRESWTYLDQYERPITESRQLITGAFDRVNREYDALGRVSRSSAPCLWSSCTLNWTVYQRDVLGRVLTATRPTSASNSAPSVESVSYEGMIVRHTDALGKQTSFTQNVLGLQQRETDALGGFKNIDYSAFGDPVRVVDNVGNTLQSMTYNVRGMLTARTDADLGSWTFTPNALGEVVSQTDAKGQSVTWQYDSLGRLLRRIEPEGTSEWTWGTSVAARNVGKLQSRTGPGYSEQFLYDSLGRLQTQTLTTDSAYQFDFAYNDIGAIETITYPVTTGGSRFKVDYDYQYGRMLRVKDFAAPSTVFWIVNAVDARGNTIDETLGNGLRTTRGFDAVTGRVDFIRSGVGGGTGVQNHSLLWDKAGNLLQRQDGNQGLTENFFYDDLHRIDYSTLNGTTNLDLAYDTLGNITLKSNVGSYTYHPTKKHAVATAGPFTFTYDANGNMTADGTGGTTTWYSFNLPNTIAGPGALGTSTSQVWYGPNRNAWKQVATYGPNTQTTHYAAGLFEKVDYAGVTQWRHYVRHVGGVAAIRTLRSVGSPDTYYLTRDHLGSLHSVSNAAAAIQVQLSFDAYGKRRNSVGWSGSVPTADWNAITATTHQGFTGHEMLDSVAMVHMGGRVFHPTIGRFMSADPLIDPATGTQGWNRFSYVGNRATSLVDPSGFGAQDTRGESGPWLCIDECPVEEIVVTAMRLHDDYERMMRDFTEWLAQQLQDRASARADAFLRGLRIGAAAVADVPQGKAGNSLTCPDSVASVQVSMGGEVKFGDRGSDGSGGFGLNTAGQLFWQGSSSEVTDGIGAIIGSGLSLSFNLSDSVLPPGMNRYFERGTFWEAHGAALLGGGIRVDRSPGSTSLSVEIRGMVGIGLFVGEGTTEGSVMATAPVGCAAPAVAPR